jgi:hypothetical protein
MGTTFNIDNEFDWFDSNRNHIIDGHRGQWVAIHNRNVSGYFNDHVAAIKFMGASGVSAGDFIVQRCLTKEEDTIHCFTPGVVFA